MTSVIRIVCIRYSLENARLQHPKDYYIIIIIIFKYDPQLL